MTERTSMTDAVNTEAVVQLAQDAVPFKNTAVGKTIRTFFQGAAGVILVFVVSDTFRDFITTRYPQLAILLPLAAALFTAIQNGIDPNVKKI